MTSDPANPEANQSYFYENAPTINVAKTPSQKEVGGEKMVVGECDLGNYSSAILISPSAFPYTSPGSGVTVTVTLNDIVTLTNTNYTCGGNTFTTANPAWWIADNTDYIILDFSAPVTNFSVVVNGTNAGEIFTFTPATGSVSLANYCTNNFSANGNQLECVSVTGGGASGTLISINNPTGSTQYTITHNGAAAGSRITLIDCLASEPEVTLTCPTNTTTTACQTQAAVNSAFATWLATASGTGGCNGVLTNNNTGAPSACGGSTTVTFTYTSTCAPFTTTCQATFTVPAAPMVTLTCPTNTTANSCQTQAAVDAAFATWLATASASGGCNGILTNNNTGAPDACGGSTTVIFTYTSTCAPLTTTCQATFTVSAPASPTPVFANCNNTINLGCNPGSLPTCSGISSGGFGGAVTASNSCGPVEVSCSAGSITVTGCSRSQVFTFTATACGLTSTCTRTFNWTQVTPPSFNSTCSNGVINLGCNPATLPACDPNITASNECGPIPVTCNVGAIQVNGCNRQQTLTYVANAPGCGNFSTCIKIYNWQVTTAPVFGNCDNTVDLGCNPATLPSCANINQTAFGGAITATNECGTVSMSCSAGAITSNGCNRTQVFTITATACGFTSTCTRTFTWQVVTAPVFASCTTGTTDLGCNPATLPSCDPNVTASSECGAATVVCTAGTITSSGCNRTQVFTYVATGACGLTSTCTRTYTWQVAPVATLTCPTNTTAAACQTQGAVNAQFAAWLATASFSGGCGAVLTNNNTGAPLSCGGSTTVTFTLTSNCQPIQTCQATFTVASETPLVIICPTATTVAACQTQAAIDAAYANWINTANSNGGCNVTGSNDGNFSPSRCGEVKTVTFNVFSTCAPLSQTCQSTFTVTAPPPVVLNCPTNATEGFGQTQAAINAAFATWLATVSASGGCDGVLTNNNTGAPAATGGSTTVTFTYTSTCAPLTTTCQATFAVTAAPPVVLNCPVNTTTTACQTQAAINAAFATWLATASASGGCNGVLTNNNTGAPAACGGSTTVTFTYTSTCEPTTTTCQATFTVPAAPTVVLTCPTNTTTTACQTQAAINAAFTTWLATASASGGCNGVLTNNNTGAPAACGGSTTVTFTYTSTCAPTTTTCQATFTVPAAPTVILTCPTNTTTTACQTQAAVNAAFATWLATASASGGCNGVLTNNNTGAPAACGGSTTVTFTYTSTCAPTITTCQATFTVPDAPPVTFFCPTDLVRPGCSSRLADSTAYDAWKLTFINGTSGGCGGTKTITPGNAPSSCGGSKTLTFTYTPVCGTPQSCEATFTIPVPAPVVLTCPTNATEAAGQTQASINTAFATWLATASGTGGCNGILTNNNTGAPPATGGSTTVTFTYTSTCAPTTTTCQATFTVIAAPPIVLTCPVNTTTTACQTQAAVNATFATWLATASGSGGCNGVLTNNNTGAPSACGGSTTVTFTYTSTCLAPTTTCQATFTVPAAPTVVLTCPVNTTTTACQTQAAVNSAFATWLATASASGGCNGVLTNNNTGAPAACGGSTTVTFTYTSFCAPTTTTCQATFTVPAAPTVILTCPTNTTTTACQTQAELNAAYAAWLATASASGGCNGVLTNNAPAAPSICNLAGSTTTVTFTYTSSCAPTTTTCQATFTVPPYPAYTVPANGASTVACLALATQPTPPTVADGCSKTLAPTGPVIVDNPNPVTCEGTRTFTWTYTDCAGQVRTWSYVYTIERNDFSVPANGAATVACAAAITQPTPPTVQSNCGETLTPTGPVIGTTPICEGTKTYTWTYTDCEGNTHDWSFVYTIERNDFTVPANGSATVACVALATQPTPPSVQSNCGEAITPTGPVITDNPTPLLCGGTRTYTWTYTDCEGNTHDWSFVYTINPVTFSVPSNGAATVACLSLATTPTPPTVNDACGNATTPTGPVVTDSPSPLACEGTRTYTWTYTNCAGSNVPWSFVYTIERNDFTLPANGAATVACPALATQPTPPTVQSNCGETITPTGPVIGATPACEGTKTYTWTYTDCEGNTHDWSFVYTIERNDFTLPTNGSATVACPALATQPTPPTVQSNCGETITPTGPVIGTTPACEGTKAYTWTYTDCEGNTHDWSFVYTIERNDFTVPANGAATVACPALATPPTPPTVQSNCGETITPTGPVITNVPSPLTCEGTRTYTWTYTDCEGNTHNWSFVYTIERNDFAVPANGTATVACPALATQPTPPTVQSNCGEVITPTGPVITNVPSPLTCEGTRTYTWTYTDCEGNTHPWSFTYNIEREPFSINVPIGTALVHCNDETDVLPTPPTVLSNCGDVLTPVLFNVTPKNGCEGNRSYTFRYTDCEGNTADWIFMYTVEYLDFSLPASQTVIVECPLNAFQPIPPTVHDNCGNLLNPIGPVISSTNGTKGCEASRTYAWTYADCEGNKHTWSKTYQFEYTADFFVYPDGEANVGCLSQAETGPIPPTIYGICGEEISFTGPFITETVDPSGCSGMRKFTFIYTDCGGHSHPWNFTYYAKDNEPPVGNCPDGTSKSVDEDDLNCIQEVPCPEDYDFGPKIQQLLEAGGFYDVCSGNDLVVKLDSWTALWECSDTDNDGEYTFGRTFYFSISDKCGNGFPDLCSVTYSGKCQPITTFSQNTWGLQSTEPGSEGITLNVIQHLLDSYGPLVVGGGNRSLTLTQAQCIANMLPGVGGPAVLANCHQTNCTGCNPLTASGLKNKLAANAIALSLSIRYSIDDNEVTMQELLGQSLDCVTLNPNIVFCSDGGDCVLRVFDANGNAHFYPYTIGGLLDLTNYYLGGNLVLSGGASGVYATALNEALEAVTNNWLGGAAPTACSSGAGAAPSDFTNKTLPVVGTKAQSFGFTLAPNPAATEFSFTLRGLTEATELSMDIYSPFGKLVLHKVFGKTTDITERISVSGLEAGLYIVSVKANGQRFEQKLVICK